MPRAAAATEKMPRRRRDDVDERTVIDVLVWAPIDGSTTTLGLGGWGCVMVSRAAFDGSSATAG